MKRYGLGLLLLCMIAVIGCGRGGPKDNTKAIANINDSNMKKVMSMYRMYQSLNRFEGPKDEAELKSFLSSDTAEARMKTLSLDTSNLDQYFTSERDGQKFKIRYGVKGSAVGSDDPIVFEVDGVSGTWQVGFTSHEIRETSSKKEYDQWMDGKYKPKNGGIPDRETPNSDGPKNFD
jgi:hypothetical protein